MSEKHNDDKKDMVELIELATILKEKDINSFNRIKGMVEGMIKVLDKKKC